MFNVYKYHEGKIRWHIEMYIEFGPLKNFERKKKIKNSICNSNARSNIGEILIRF